MTCYLNIGTNLGDRLSNLERAVALLEARSGSRCRMSSVIESAPCGYVSPRAFLNIGVAMEWEGSPLELLELTQGVERALGSGPHRDRSGGYLDRLIDIDIIEIEGVAMNHPRLTLPHPRAAERAFVTRPLNELKRTVRIDA